MKKLLLFSAVAAGLILSGCSSGSGSSSDSISGTVSVTANVKISRFTFDDFFIGSSSPDEDKVSSLFGSQSYTPLAFVLSPPETEVIL